MQELSKLINLMPGYISVIDLKGNYLAFNNNLKQLMSIDNPVGMKAGTECKQQINRINNLINSSVGTTINWEYQHDHIWLAISSIRNEDYILNQAVDITSQKRLEEELRSSEERNQLLLKNLPETLQDSGKFTSTSLITSKGNELSSLINMLTEKPIVSQNTTESLIRLEVELRQNSTRLTNIEKLLYLDEASLTSRIKELEIHQRNDLDSWEDFEKDKQLIKDFSRIICAITNIPGGLKTWFILFLIFNTCLVFASELVIRYLDLKQFIPVQIISK